MTPRHIAAVGAVVLLALFASRAWAEEDVAALMQEATQLAAERDEIPKTLEANLSLKRSNEAKIQQLSAEDERLAAESSSIEADRPMVNSLCQGTVPEDEFAAAQERCDAALQPFNERVASFNASMQKLNDEYDEVNRSEQARVAEAQAMLARDQELAARISALQTKIMQMKQPSCVESCNSEALSLDEQAQCLQHCWDQAAPPADLPTVEEKYRPPFSAGPARTPDQAIEEYKASGKASPGPDTLHTNPVPAPPPEE